MTRCLAIACTLAAIASSPAHAQTAGLQQIAGAQMYVQRVGTGPPILFLHGGLVFFDNNFAKQRDYFSSFREVIGFDRPGHGHSPDDGKPFSYRKMAEETAALIEALGIGPVDIVGHSDGGNIGLIVAAEHPNLVRRLVVSGANIRAGLPPEELKRRESWTPEQVTAKVREFETRLPPFMRADYEKVAPGGAAAWPVLMEKFYRLALVPIAVDPAALKQIRTPVLVIAGDKDFTSIEETLEIQRAIPKARLFIVPGTGHGTFTQQPELMNLAIRRFLEAPAAGK